MAIILIIYDGCISKFDFIYQYKAFVLNMFNMVEII